MTDSPFFTIIIPCYNAEKTLQQAVYSITKQDFESIEVLIIDDCSKDWSFAIAHNLADEDDRIRIIALADNNGPAEARNKGLLEARGRYIMFLDADDIYEDGLLREVAKAAGDGPDVVIWGDREECLDEKGNLKSEKVITCPAETYKDAASLRSAVMDLEEKSLYGYLWNKAYKASLLRNLRIPDQTFNEDEMFNIAFFNKAESAVMLDTPGTHYRRTRTSLTHRKLADYYPIAMKRIAGLMQQHKLWGLYTDEVHTRLANLYLRYMLSTLERLHNPAMGYSEKARILFMQRVFASRLYREMVPYMKPRNPVLKALAKGLKKQKPKKCLKLGKRVHRLKEAAPVFFDRVK